MDFAGNTVRIGR